MVLIQPKRLKFGNTIRCLALSVALSAVALSGTHADQPTAKDHLEEATRNIIQAIELFIKTIPQYEAPEILENGDIIIRKKQKDAPSDPQDQSEQPDKTQT